MLLVVGSDQDTVRFSVCVCEFFMLAEKEGGREREVGMRKYNHQLNTVGAPGIPGKRICASCSFYSLQLPSVKHQIWLTFT